MENSSLSGIFNLKDNWAGLKILLADANKKTQGIFIKEFLVRNLNCDIVENELDAMRLIGKKGEYDIYFVDHNLPKVTSLGLPKWIKVRSKEIGKDSEIFIITNDYYSSSTVSRWIV